MKIENLLYKIKKVKMMCVFNILTALFTMTILSTLNVNMILFGSLIYLLSLYIICFFATNITIYKYKNNYGEFEMDKLTFTNFFKKGKQLKYLLLSLFPITCILWVIILLKYDKLILYLSTLDIISFSIISVFLFWSIKEMINSFVTTIYLTRIIEYICVNNLLKKNK